MIEVYKILMNVTTGKRLKGYSNWTKETRGNPYQLKTKKPRLAIRKNFFAVAAVADWNSLPETVVRCDNVNAFKRSLDRHWEHKMFNTEFLVRNGLTWKSWSTEAVAYRSEKNLWTCEKETSIEGHKIFPPGCNHLRLRLYLLFYKWVASEIIEEIDEIMLKVSSPRAQLRSVFIFVRQIKDFIPKLFGSS